MRYFVALGILAVLLLADLWALHRTQRRLERSLAEIDRAEAEIHRLRIERLNEDDR